MWWVLTSYQVTPGFNTLEVSTSTNALDHLSLAWEYYAPAKHPIHKTVRGLRVICGYQWVWDTPRIQEQTEPGDTLDHTFSLTNLTPGSTIYFYAWAPGGPYGLEIQGPLDRATLTEAPEGAIPIPEPICWDLPDRHIRCGNRYTFWANATWYAVLPTTTLLTVWKLIDGAMVRQDPVHEPAVPDGVLDDADSRLSSDGATIHVVYYEHMPSPGPHVLRYVTFDIATDTWAMPELICTPNETAFITTYCSIALDAADVPHVAYNDCVPTYPGVDYRNRIGGSWSAAEAALRIPYKAMGNISASIDPLNDAFHVCAVANTYQRWYNRRPYPPAPWDGALMTGLATNLDVSSHTTSNYEPHIAQTNRNWRIDHYEGLPPIHVQEDLTAATSDYANMIEKPGPTRFLCIVFRDTDWHLATIHRTPDELWQPQVQLEPADLNILTAHYAAVDVISCLWQRPGFQAVCFYAFWCPWHED